MRACGVKEVNRRMGHAREDHGSGTRDRVNEVNEVNGVNGVNG